MKKSALIIHGGWDGHEPKLVSETFSKILINEGFEVTISDSLEAFLDEEK